MPKHLRCGRVIRTGDKDEVFDSITLAKRASRRLQLDADGALGRGSLQVVDKLPPLKK